MKPCGHFFSEQFNIQMPLTVTSKSQITKNLYQISSFSILDFLYLPYILDASQVSEWDNFQAVEFTSSDSATIPADYKFSFLTFSSDNSAFFPV